MISINTVCQNVRHKGNFEICRPDGSGDDLLVIFKTSAVLIQNGEEITVSPDSLILYSKGTMQHYKTLCGSYVNHFVHFDTDDTELMNGIKTDTLITSADIPAIEELLTILCREHVAGSTNRKQYENMLMQMILMKISESSIIPVGAFRGQPLYAQVLISAGEPTIYVSVSSVKSTIMPTEAISAQCSKKFIIKVYSLPYKVVFQIIILGNFPVLTRCDPCSFFEYLHKAYLISVSAEVGYFLNGHIGGRKIILSCLDLCG